MSFRNPSHAGSPATSAIGALAPVLATFLGDNQHIRITAYDNSAAGPPHAQYGLHLVNARAAAQLLYAPGELGLARAYIAGDLEARGVHPADPYPLLAHLLTDLKVRIPAPRSLVQVLRTVGAQNLRPAPPPQEHRPRWRRLATGLVHSRFRDAEAVERHYDVSNTFYRQVLGPSMTYTCAVFPTPDATLDDAQGNKYRLVFDKLGLEPGQRLLDVGCGWGAMVLYAARRGVRALGVTLSHEQAQWAQKAIAEQGLGHLAEVRYCDYRDVTDRGFDAISSIGMAEHVGVRHLADYFTFLGRALRPGGRLLNHCITRPNNTSRARAGAFIDRYVFPDGELTGAGRLIATAQDTGLEVVHEENLREHYALTLRSWCANLTENWDAAVAEVGEPTARVWGLYMAGSRLGFERNLVQLHQVLAVKPDGNAGAAVPLRPWWRP
ncbi:class I SAM-dependent methyltransferase [Rhodococcus pyridinivorans]|uniref:class I SAM-dependent methyltransferase n=1 Tax=Rhodococcus pyridinivorans TaxID=103816 RepID=UPI000BA24C28|nr:class I SAM-dependent methyltransferase [Rhodococcus pyridinivorans]